MKRILVALDASPRAPQVLAAADRLAELTGAKPRGTRSIEIPRRGTRRSIEIPRMAEKAEW